MDLCEPIKLEIHYYLSRWYFIDFFHLNLYSTVHPSELLRIKLVISAARPASR